jgi:hypothetical protein
VYALVARAPIPVQEALRRTVVESMVIDDDTSDLGPTPVDAGHGTDALSDIGGGQPSSPHIDILHPQMTESDIRRHPFMKAAPKRAVDQAIGEFIDRTGNSALAIGACAVCAREMNRRELTPHRIDALPNDHHLRPEISHPAHDIFNKMLLHPPGVTTDGKANVCMDCVRALNADRLPSLALANGLWIGRTPHELAYLTLPERLLIAKYFPTAYIIKLFPSVV